MFKHSPKPTRMLPQLSAEEKEKHDKRYFMGTYGTFAMDTIHGRLFELQVYVDSQKYHTLLMFAFTLFSLVIWPIAGLLAIPLAYLPGPEPGRYDKDVAMLRIILVLASGIGYVLWSFPLIIVSLGGGFQYFLTLIEKKELNFLDFVDFVLSELMILLTVLFAWVFHEISINTTKYKDSAVESWRSRHDAYGLDVQFHKPQYNRLIKVLKESGEGECSETKDLDEERGTIFIEDVLQILDILPGWTSSLPRIDQGLTDHLKEKTGIEAGLFADLQKITDEAKEKSIWPIDVWLVREQYYPDYNLDVGVGLYVAYHNTIDMIRLVMEHFEGCPVQATVVIILALARAFLPRVWLWSVLGGTLWPSDVFGPAGRLVAFSTIVTFTVSIVWIGLFWFVLMEYRRNLVQCMIVSSLVDARCRVKFSQCYLMSCFWFGMDSNQSEDVLGKLPVLDMRVSSNVAAFWRLREYCTLDRANERMGICVLLEIVIIWLFLKFVVTMATMYVYKGLPAILVVTLFDLIVFGMLIIIALQAALAMNGMMEQHKQVFVEARYEVTMARGAQSKDLDALPDQDLELSRRLLLEYLDLCNENDARDTILFGMEVTPGKILSSAGTVAMAVFTLLNKMMQNGQVDVPDALEEKMKANAAMKMSMAALGHTAKFLSGRTLPWAH